MATSIASFTLSNSPSVYAVSQTASVSWSAGDRIVVGYCAANGAQSMGTPTATGLTFASAVAQPGTGATSADVGFYEAIAPAAGSSVTITASVSGNTDAWCFGVWVITGGPGQPGASSAIAETGTGNSTARSVASAAGDIVLMVESDWSAAAAGQTLSTGSGTSNKRDNAQVAGVYTYLFGEWVGTAATTASYGSTSYTSRTCSTAALVIKAAPSAIVATSKAATSPGSTPQQTVTSASASFAAGSRILVFATAMRDNHSNGLDTNWSMDDSATTNNPTWSKVATGGINTAVGASYGCQMVAYISSPLGSTESFTVTADAHAGGASNFYYGLNVIELTGASDTIVQSDSDEAAVSSNTGTFGVAPDGFQIGGMYALSNNSVAWDTAPDEWAALPNAASTVDGSTSVNVIFSYANTATGVTWGWADATEQLSNFLVLELNEASAATLTQDGFRWGEDDGSESAHTWAAAEDTNLTGPLGSKLLRAQVNASGDPVSTAYTLRYQKNGAGGYVAVPTVASVAEVFGTVTYGALGTAANGTTSCTPSYPTGITAGQYLLCHVTSGNSGNGTPTMPGDWTQLATVASTDGTYGLDTGPRRATVFGKVADGTESGTVTVSLTSGDTMRASISRWTKSAGDSWVVDAVTGHDSDGGTSVSVTFGSVNWHNGDAVAIVNAQRVDSVTQSAQSITATGITMGTRTNRASTAVTTGNDHRHVVDTVAAVSAADPSEDAAPTWSYTASAACSAAVVLVRLRGYSAAVTNQVYVSASANIAAGGEATTARLTAPSGKTTSDFTTGRRWDDENGTDSIDIGAEKYTEVEWRLTTPSPAATSDYFDFRVYAGSSPLDTYAVTPRWTIDPDIDASAGQASATAAAQAPAVNVAPNAGQASATATAHDATVSAGTGVKWDTVTHDFPGSSLDSTFWPGTYGTAPTVSGNKLSFAADANYSGVATIGRDLTASSVLLLIDPVTVGGYCGVNIKGDASNTDICYFNFQTWPGFGIIEGVYKGSNWSGTDSDANTAWANTAVWVRFREASGTIYIEYSTTGTSWTVLHSAALDASALTALADCKVELATGPFGATWTAGPGFSKLNIPPGDQSVNAGQASATATAQQPAASVAPNAGQATATASAFQASIHVQPNAGQASATAAGQQPSIGLSPNAGQAAATATAQQPSTWIYVNASTAAATAGAQQAAAHIQPAAGSAAAVAAANTANANVAPGAGSASATATAHDATGSSSIAATAGQAAAIAVAWLASVALAVPAAAASSTATAHDATVGITNYGQAGEAAATATAHDATVRVAPNAGVAAATATGQQPSVSVAINAGQAVVTVTGQQPAAGVSPAAGTAAATATGQDATTAQAVTPTAGEAAATAAAHNASVHVAASAGSASATAAGHNPAADVGAPKWDDQTVDFDNAPGDIFLTSGVAPTYIGNRARWDVGASDGALYDYTDRDLTESYVLIKAEPNPSYGYLEFQITRNNGATIIGSVYKRADTNVLNIYYNGSTVATPTWDATAMAWWRWRESGGTLFLETSPNGGAWTERWSSATAGATFDLTTVEVVLNGGSAVGGQAPSTGIEYAYFSKFNLAPPAGLGSAGEAAATAEAYNATVRTDNAATAGLAQVTATAYNAGVDTPVAHPPEAASSATAQQPSIAIAVGAGQGSAAATAHDATVSTALAKWGQVTNDFTNFVGDNFDYSGSIDISDYVGGRCRFLVQGLADGLLRDFNDRDLTSSSVALLVEPNPDYGYIEFQLTQDNGATVVASAYKRADQSVLTVVYNGSTVATPTYDPATMGYWRWREDAGTLYFETGRNGVNYTTRWSSASAGTDFDLTLIEIIIAGGGLVGGSAPDEQYAWVSKFNIVPAGAPAELASATATAHDAYAQTLNAGDVLAQVATAVATAHFDTGTTIGLSMVADAPIELPAVAHDATVRTSNNPTIGSASAAATAHNATVSTASQHYADAGSAAATATAHDATIGLGSGPTNANAGQAAATATAHNATISTGETRSANAGQAQATATAHDAVVQVGARPARINASTTVYVPSIAKTVIAPIVNAVATIPAPTLRATSTVTPGRVNGLATVFVPGISMRANAPYFEATTTFFMPTPAEAQFVLVQVWNGTNWQSGVLNVWNGSEWKPGSLRVYQAGGWQPT